MWTPGTSQLIPYFLHYLSEKISTERFPQNSAILTRQWDAARKKIYVIKSSNFTGTLIYTKGKIDRKGDEEVFYVLISSKIAIVGD